MDEEEHEDDDRNEGKVEEEGAVEEEGGDVLHASATPQCPDLNSAFICALSRAIARAIENFASLQIDGHTTCLQICLANVEGTNGLLHPPPVC